MHLYSNAYVFIEVLYMNVNYQKLTRGNQRSYNAHRAGNPELIDEKSPLVQFTIWHRKGDKRSSEQMGMKINEASMNQGNRNNWYSTLVNASPPRQNGLHFGKRHI